MDNCFNLTKCKKVDLRHRTLSGKIMYYLTYFEPKGLDKQGRRYAIDHFKHPSTKEEKCISNQMIEYAIDEFLKIYDINQFDIILGMPSSSGVVKKIIDKLKNKGFYGDVVYKGFVKNRMRNTYLREDLLNRESSLKTKEKVPKSFTISRTLHYDKVAKSSLFPTRFRRYVGGLLRINFNRGLNRNSGIQRLSTLFNKKVLIVDDTFGEGLTLREAMDRLNPYTKNVIGFTVMKDMGV